MADKQTAEPPPRQRPWSTKPVISLPEEAGFTKAEHWAWARILNGMIADMARYPGDNISPEDEGWLLGAEGEEPDPKNPQSFAPHQHLSERLLRTVLFHEPWASAPERPGVRIQHARIMDEIDWTGRRTSGEIWLDYCRLEGTPFWQGMTIAGGLSLDGAILEQDLNADGLHVAGDLFCRNGFTAKGTIRLVGAQIGGQAAFVSAVLEQDLIADDLHVAGGLFCPDGFIAKGEVRLVRAQISGNAEFDGAVLEQGLNADGLHVAGDVFCRDGFTAKGGIDLPGAQIGGDLQIRKSWIEGEIGLTGARIGGELHLDKNSETRPEWGENAALILRNARIGALAGGLDSFRKVRIGPAKRNDFPRLDFTGLRYEELGGLGASDAGSLAHAQARDLIALLEAASEPEEDQFSPGPYRQMANVLADSGQKSKSIELLRAMRKHERKCAKGARKIGLSLSGWLTGFGYRPWYAAGWFMLLTAIWTLIGLAMTSDFDVRFPTPADIAWQIRWFWFTIGNALPLISLDEAHKTFLADAKNVEPHNVPVVMASLFYIHKLLGYSLITYLAASLTGVTDKRS